MIQTLQQAARSLARRPGFTAVVLLILALCIGGNASMFSVANAVFFRDLGYQNLDRLVLLVSFYTPISSETILSWAEVEDWKRRSHLLEEVYPFTTGYERLIVLPDAVERIRINHAPSGYLKLLGVRPQLGRLFTPEEDSPPGSAPVIILSHEVWQRIYHRNPQIVGQKIQLNDKAFTVVGVLPAEFYDVLEAREPVDAWIPASMVGDVLPADLPVFTSREERIWYAIARLKPGVTQEQAQQEADTIAGQLQQEFPQTNKDHVAQVIPLRSYMFPNIYQGAAVLAAGALLVLLIGCANTANLLMVRMAERSRELSLRLALGADRRQMAQYVFAEGLILALAGGALGVLIAYWGTKLMADLTNLPAFTRVTLDAKVLGFTLLLTLLTGFLFALPAALRTGRLRSQETLQVIRSGDRVQSARGLGGSLVFQIAIVVILLIVANLLLRSFLRLRSETVGFDTKSLLTLHMDFGAEKYQDRTQVSAAMKEILRRVKEVPEVKDATIWGTDLPGISAQFTELQREGAAETEGMVRADLHLVSPGALHVLGIPVQRGREFTPQDTREVPRVAMVSQSLADVLWPGQDPVGKRFFRPNRENGAFVTVVGVIPARLQSRFGQTNHQLLFPNSQVPGQEGFLMARTDRNMGPVAEKLKEVIRSVDLQIPIFDVVSMEERLRKEETMQRLNAVVVGGYSVLALVLSMLGLYGMLVYSVVQRTREIGLRMALGANQSGILGMIMGKGMALVGTGLALGVVGALASTRLLSSQLFGVTARDPVTFAMVVLIFVAVALIATYLPARRAIHVKPTIALRYD
jgi:putative ABC transport system permease protein